jgi:hypothetical protein
MESISHWEAVQPQTISDTSSPIASTFGHHVAFQNSSVCTYIHIYAHTNGEEAVDFLRPIKFRRLRPGFFLMLLYSLCNKNTLRNHNTIRHNTVRPSRSCGPSRRARTKAQQLPLQNTSRYLPTALIRAGQSLTSRRAAWRYSLKSFNDCPCCHGSR